MLIVSKKYLKISCTKKGSPPLLLTSKQIDLFNERDIFNLIFMIILNENRSLLLKIQKGMKSDLNIYLLYIKIILK